MFYGCTSLKNMPQILSTKPNQNSYAHMFEGCTSLENVTDLSIATYADQNTYSSAFYGCKKLTKAPKIIINSIDNAA